MLMIFIKTCGWCGAEEERIFTDSWTGTELCLECLDRTARYVTNSPATEGDNLGEALTLYALDRKESEEVFTL